jgi:outer membrane protein insertion porin family
VVVGGGISSNDGLVGQFRLSFGNFDIADLPESFGDLLSGNAFVGAGQKLLLSWQPGTEYQQARVMFADPYIFDTQYSFSIDFFLYERERDHHDEDRSGVRLAIGKNLTDRLSARLLLRMEEVDIDDLSSSAAPDVVAVAGKNDVHSLSLKMFYDHTDRPRLPSEGYSLSGSVEVAGGFLGSDWSFVKGELGGAYYHPLFETGDGRKHVLGFGLNVGAVDATGGDDVVPLFERFYAGGRNSVRGFGYRGLGPTQGDTEVGGEFSVVANVEYTFPIYQMVEQGQPFEVLRGVLFVDVGKVAYDLNDIGDAKWRSAAGFGFRLSLPALGSVPIALDFGFPLSKEDGDDTQVFSFSMATSF